MRDEYRLQIQDEGSMKDNQERKGTIVDYQNANSDEDSGDEKKTKTKVANKCSGQKSLTNNIDSSQYKRGVCGPVNIYCYGDGCLRIEKFAYDCSSARNDPSHLTKARGLCDGKQNCTLSSIRNTFPPKGGCEDVPDIEMNFFLREGSKKKIESEVLHHTLQTLLLPYA